MKVIPKKIQATVGNFRYTNQIKPNIPDDMRQRYYLFFQVKNTELQSSQTSDFFLDYTHD